MKTKLNRLLAVFFLSVLCNNAVAVGLAEVLDSARRNDPNYKAALSGLNASQYDRGIGLSALLPNISGSFQKGRAQYDRDQLSSTGSVLGTDSNKLDVENYSITLRQTLFNLDSIARYRNGYDSADLAELEFKKFENEFIVQVTTTYIEVLRALDTRNTTSAEFDAMRSLVALTEKQIQGGESNKLNLLEAIAKRDIANAQFLEAEQNLENAVRALEATSGLKIFRIATLADDFNFNIEPNNTFIEFRNSALINNPEIAASKKRIELANNELTRAWAGHAPRLEVVAVQSQSQNDSVNTVNLRSESTTLALQMQVPIFSGFAAENQRKKSIQLIDKARNEHQAAIKKTLTDLRKHYTASSLSFQKAKAFRKAVESSNESVKATELGLKAGVNIEFDALTARQQLTKAKLEEAKVRYDSIVSMLLLRASVGNIDSDTVEILNGIFSEERSAAELSRPEELEPDVGSN